MSQSPTFTAVRVVELPEKDQGIQNSIVRLYSHRIDKNKRDPKRFLRRQAVLIRNLDSENCTIRFVMGSGQLGVKKNELALDYDACDALGVRFHQPVNLEVRPAKKMEVMKFYFNHPDMGIRVSMRLAVAGIYLGVLGTAVGIVSAFAL